ncbi:hypothetical protein ACF5W4_09380 [Bacillota bacterium Lsc_1132]
MDRTLGYLREILSNYTEEHSKGRQLFRKLSEGNFPSEEAFVRHLLLQKISRNEYFLGKRTGRQFPLKFMTRNEAVLRMVNG